MRIHEWIHRRIPALYALPGMGFRLDARLQGGNDSHLPGLLRHSRSGCRGLGVIQSASRSISTSTARSVRSSSHVAQELGEGAAPEYEA
jgi:hypothetical protein